MVSKKKKTRSDKAPPPGFGYAVLEDYLNSIELDGSETNHVQREAAALFGNTYGRVTARRKLAVGAKVWALRLHKMKARG